MRVYLADEDLDVRQALRLILQQRLGFQVVGEAAHTQGLASLVESSGAELIMIEWNLPGRVDARLLANLHALDRSPRIIVLASVPDAEECALSAGADGFVSKTDSPERMLALLQPSCSVGTDR